MARSGCGIGSRAMRSSRRLSARRSPSACWPPGLARSSIAPPPRPLRPEVPRARAPLPGAVAARPGVVYLVGAGPGDPGLVTLRAAELIATADVIVHDRLIPRGSLDGARPDAELIYAGKRPYEREAQEREPVQGRARIPIGDEREAQEREPVQGRARMPSSSGDHTAQADIEQLIVERARSGRSVVRLKGGDPFVFGRGGEEAEALAAAGVPFEVVPGVTAGVAAPAYAGIPVTHRDAASAVAFVTGHEDPEKDESALDWDALGRFPGTLVLYMGVRRLREVADRLIGAGRDAREPAAVVARGTFPD